MATKATKAKAEGTAGAGSSVPAFPKERILTFKRYAKRRDLLSILLKDGQEYTHEQVESLINNFMKKGQVK